MADAWGDPNLARRANAERLPKPATRARARSPGRSRWAHPLGSRSTARRRPPKQSGRGASGRPSELSRQGQRTHFVGCRARHRPNQRSRAAGVGTHRRALRGLGRTGRGARPSGSRAFHAGPLPHRRRRSSSHRPHHSTSAFSGNRGAGTVAHGSSSAAQQGARPDRVPAAHWHPGPQAGLPHHHPGGQRCGRALDLQAHERRPGAAAHSRPGADWITAAGGSTVSVRLTGALFALLLTAGCSGEVLQADNARVRALPPGINTTVAYADLVNTGANPITLTAARSPHAETIEFHETTRSGQIMQMRRMDSIVVQGHQTVRLAPGGLHLMLLGVTRLPAHIEVEFSTSEGRTFIVAFRRVALGAR
ncbi:MAG: hypothetical protein CMQ49_12840 [Gammaproteobacteria bacterium]|nr:hypothetical protein [Gammaproteobacteria bacterium]